MLSSGSCLQRVAGLVLVLLSEFLVPSSDSVTDGLSKEVSRCYLLVRACNALQGLFWFYYRNF